MAVGDNIKRLRKLKKVQVADLAESTKIKPESIYAWERGDYNPSEVNLQKLSSALGVPVSAFYEENSTSVQKEPAVKGNAIDLGEAIRLIVEGSEYYVIPKVALEGKYRLMPLEELTMKEKELERKSQDLIRKDDQILGLQELVKMVASKVPDASKIQEAQKNTSV